MGVPHVTSFCWCMGLELGAKCIGLIHLLVSLALMILCLVYAVEFYSLARTDEDAGDGVYMTWYKISLTVATFTLVHVVMGLALLVSAFKRSVRGVRGWVYVMSALCAAALLCVLVLAALYGVSGSGSGWEIFLSFLEGVIFFGVLAYCILCVNSYYLTLKSAEDMEGPHKTDY